MKLGLFLMPLHYPHRPHYETYEEDLELMAHADGLGFSETWVGEHFTLPWENMPSPELFIARALGVTEQMKFGTGVSLLHYHHPAHVAHRIAMLDHMAKGRIYLGIGSGGPSTDTELFGLDTELGEPRERLYEAVDLILKIWDGEPFEYESKFYDGRLPEAVPERRLGFHMLPYQKPHPPIAVAGSSPFSGTLEIVGERGWMPLSTCFLHDTFLPSHWQVVTKGAAKSNIKASRKEWRISREVHVAEDGDKAREEALHTFGRFFEDYWIPLLGSGRGLDGLKTDPDMPDEKLTPEYMLENLWVVGDPDEVTSQLRKLHDDVGGFGTLLMLCHDWEDNRQKWLDSMTLMSEEVLPNLP